MEPYENHKTSVKTFIVHTNLDVDIERIFSERIFPVVDYEMNQKRRGRKKKTESENSKPQLSNGDIIHVNFRKEYYGIKPKNNSEFFRNAMSIVMYVDEKFVNFKLTQKGKLQMTGCKTDEQAKLCVRYFWSNLEPHSDVYTLKTDKFTVYYEPVMRNIGFCLNFKVDRYNLDEYINTSTSHISIFETTLGYAGVNIKFNIDNIEEILDRAIIETEQFDSSGRMTQGTIGYRELMKLMKTKRKQKKYVTFLVFQSGKVIMSGNDTMLMREPYYQFMNIVTSNRKLIEEHM